MPPRMDDADTGEHDGGRSCDDLVLERGRCVGWRVAAPLPDSIDAPQLVQAASSGEYAVRLDDAVVRYIASEDRWEPIEGTFIDADVPAHSLPAVTSEYGRVVGWLPDGMRVFTNVGLYSVTWVAQRDDHGDGVWRSTVQPDPLFTPSVAYPLDVQAIMFAGRQSGIFVAR